MSRLLSSMNFLGALSLAPFIAMAYSVIYVTYQLWFHPLRKYPGPGLAAITKWYKGYYDLVRGGELLEHIQELHQRHGSVIRIGPNELHFASPRAYHQIYAPGSRYPKEPFFYRGFGLDKSTFGITGIEGAKARRDMLAPLFSRRAILKLEPVIQEKVDLLVSQLAKYDGKPADLYFASHSVSLDVIASYCFSYSFDALRSTGFKHPMLLSLDKLISYFWYTRYFHFILPLTKFMTTWFGDNELSIGHTTIQRRVAAQVDLLLGNDAALDNFEHEIIYHHLLRPQSEKARENRLTRQQLIEDGQVLITAGSDTVANTLVWGIFYTLLDTSIHNKLIAELRDAWPDKNEPMAYTALEKLPYLTAVIKESLRLMSGLVTPLPRVVTSDVYLDEYLVPKGTIVSTGHTFVHRDPALFPNPHEFNPERWLQQTSNELDNNLVPFSRGPRMCLGINLAWCELYLLFANVFRKLDMELYETGPTDFRYKEIFIPVLLGRHLHATVRESKD